MYFQLQDGCNLVKGATRAAIYDCNTGKVYSINMDAAHLLDACYVHPIEELWNVASPDNHHFMDFLNNLCTKNLGLFSTTKPTIEQIAELPFLYSPIKLDFLWLELTSTCNSKCLHCYAECTPSSPPPQQVPHDRWLSLLVEAKEAGASAVQFIGGEPLLYPAWQELVIQAHNLSYEYIEIFTNGTLVDDDCIEFFKKYKVNIATTLYADNAETHDKITLQPNSFIKTMTTINKLKVANLPLRVASIIMKDNEHEVENLMKLYEKWGMKDAYPDVIRPTGRGDDLDLAPLHFHKPPIKPPFHTNECTFFTAHHYHECLAGKLAITATGDVIPCIFARQQLCGNILKNTLQEIVNGQSLTQCWNTTKDYITTCKDCEYRYACSDCRPLAQSQDSEKSWFAHPHSCSYNPYTGTWG